MGVPLTASSANISGQGENADSFKILRDFQEKDVTIIDGGRTLGGLTSTIIDLTGSNPENHSRGRDPGRLSRALSCPESALLVTQAR